MKRHIFLICWALAIRSHAQVFTTQAAFQTAIANDPGQFLNTFTSIGPSWSGGTPTMTYSTPGVSVNGGHVWQYTVIRLDFTSGNVKAVGGNYFGMADYDHSVNPSNVTLTYSNGVTDTYSASGSNIFRGYLSPTALSWMEIRVDGIGAWSHPSVDDLITSAGPVPEPGSLAALGLGLCVLRRSRTKRA